ncbi:hypothetical protein Tco_1019458 [Tanacetum coccineum]|uniref:Uncharacterized protein n=1 Tax=Tanacetum coccineum TaxID=301880 RepID=A0ABQ5FX78_9ASTR
MWEKQGSPELAFPDNKGRQLRPTTHYMDFRKSGQKAEMDIRGRKLVTEYRFGDLEDLIIFRTPMFPTRDTVGW